MNEFTQEELDSDKSESLYPSLQINDGQIFRIPSGSNFKFGNVIVGKGGQLLVEGPIKAWTEIHINGDFLLYGTLRLQGFSRGNIESEVITAVASDGRPLTFTYRHTSLGGHGGKGVDQPTVRKGLGGRGGAGNFLSGGGGGGGAGLGGRGPTGTNGGDGVGRTGGEGGPGSCDSRVCGARGGRGGDGGYARDFDGGLMYMTVYGSFDATGGDILGAGLTGKEGGRGEDADVRRGGEGGGGGGGGPGGHGGCVIMAVKAERIGVLPNINLAGGAGGNPGDGGIGWKGAGERGQPGESGGNGKFEIYELT